MNEAVISELILAVRETNRWLRIMALPALRQMLEAELDGDVLRRIYQESDGRQIRDVAKSANVGYATVQKYWQRWARTSIVEPTGIEGRFRRLIDLRQLGMESADDE